MQIAIIFTQLSKINFDIIAFFAINDLRHVERKVGPSGIFPFFLEVDYEKLLSGY